MGGSIPLEKSNANLRSTSWLTNPHLTKGTKRVGKFAVDSLPVSPVGEVTENRWDVNRRMQKP